MVAAPSEECSTTPPTTQKQEAELHQETNTVVNTCAPHDLDQGPGLGIQIKELTEALPVVVSPPSADKAVIHVETPEKEISRPLGDMATATMKVSLPELPSGSLAQSSTLEKLPPSPFMEAEVGNTEELCDGAFKCETIPLDGEDVQPQASVTTLVADKMDLQELLSKSLSSLTFSRFPTMARAQTAGLGDYGSTFRRTVPSWCSNPVKACVHQPAKKKSVPSGSRHHAGLVPNTSVPLQAIRKELEHLFTRFYNGPNLNDESFLCFDVPDVEILITEDLDIFKLIDETLGSSQSLD
ncbi:uncharacterized protein LOC134018223 [Osmerus eperlanus]|uniref:uncharacterized protein LOC134018223 n=1 Tax=Osmerus eperlanus TaxID=29151 RepID=UPI002E10E705